MPKNSQPVPTQHHHNVFKVHTNRLQHPLLQSPRQLVTSCETPDLMSGLHRQAVWGGVQQVGTAAEPAVLERGQTQYKPAPPQLQSPIS
jgi:hypothetical protein